jgi:N-methylhydantoinase A/oxoprolinase/acetone carboxylase beta subunit/N-methylhydantoinase B/oxoprolinase/acetone carboxylase alpha subunit
VAVCLGIDVGGTFTDAVLTDGAVVWRAKSPTVPEDVGQSVLDACALVAARAGVSLTELLPRVERFGLGTTAVTNVIASRAGVAVGLITTAGFEDALPLAKGRRVTDGVWSLYPEPVVPRERIAGVHERVDRDGAVLVPLDPDEAVAAARSLVEAGAVSLAVSLLWSFRNPGHEEQATAAIRQALPGVPVVSGADLQPTIREFERTAYAVLNAYSMAAVAGIDRLTGRLAELGLAAPVLLVHSGGGTMTTHEARQAPILLAASGPAAGVAASAAIAQAGRAPDVVTCDMGGTSFDVSVVTGGRIPRRTRSEVAGLLTSLSMVDIESIGAGGGSLAWVDARGMLRVGPQSAGAVPGPACYGRGGTEPTVTDALVVLGYVDPDRFLGGEMALDAEAARAACARLGRQLSLDATECAWGIRRIALDGMITAVRSLLDVRGLAAASHGIVSFGGCGGLFTSDIAASLGMGRVLVPELSSVLSAFGAATADIRRERVRSLAAVLPGDVSALAKVADELRHGVEADLAADGIDPAGAQVHFEADLRFKRQVWELNIALDADRLDEASVTALIEEFRSEYVRRYGAGSMMLGAPVELVTLRAVGVVPTVKPPVTSGRLRPVRAGTAAPVAGERRVRVGRGSRGWVRVPVHDGTVLRPGHVLSGPALVDERDTTVWIPAGASASVARSGTLAVEVEPAAAGADGRSGRRPTGSAADPIALELLRSQLQAVVEEAAGAIERTAISPVVTESKDYSATLLDAQGNLVAGGGVITYHWVAATRAVRATLARYGDSIAPGDVFLANDPYDGGGLHPNDVFVQRPIFIDGDLVAWAALSAHLIDMGGMVMGSFAPAATECYQEALRIPPVRILRQGTEVSEVWDIFRTNVRLDVLVEMDLRGLVAGGNVAHDKVVDLVGRRGVADMRAGMTALQALSEVELRRRIATLEDGTYRATGWVEWDEELHQIPCTLTVDGDRLDFDFTGAAPQTPHFFNSKPYIVKSGFMMQAAVLLAPDLPYTEGLLTPIDLHCPEGSIVNSVPPAPINAGHIHVAFTATEVMLQCLRLAIWASPGWDRECPVTGLASHSAIALNTWSGMGLDGVPDTWLLMDGSMVGGGAGDDRDGLDMGGSLVGTAQPAQVPDVEILESWYPMLIGQRTVQHGAIGAGRARAGGGNHMTFTPHGTPRLIGQMLAMRAYVPLEGAAGGRPGAVTRMAICRADGSRQPVSTAAAGVVLEAGESFEILCASGGGVGDPVLRPPDAVARDVASGRISAEEAAEVYGVVVGPPGRSPGEVDRSATGRRRRAILRRRLRQAGPAARPLADDGRPAPSDPAGPLYPGVVEVGGRAYAEASGAPLADAPDHFTDGCPVLESAPGPGPGIVTRTYLDPRTGHALMVEVVPAGTPRAFDVLPARWR